MKLAQIKEIEARMIEGSLIRQKFEEAQRLAEKKKDLSSYMNANSEALRYITFMDAILALYYRAT